MATTPVIQTHDLTKAFRTYRKEEGLKGAFRGLFHRKYTETLAADRVSFSVGEGEFVGFLGAHDRFAKKLQDKLPVAFGIIFLAFVKKPGQ